MLNTPLPKVLIVEDDILLNRLLRKGFEAVQFPTLQAYTLASAIDVLKRDDIGVIVLDLGLPDGNGWELVDKLPSLKLPSEPKIIIITGRDNLDDVPDSVRVYHILQKPVNITELIRLAIQIRYRRKI